MAKLKVVCSMYHAGSWITITTQILSLAVEKANRIPLLTTCSNLVDADEPKGTADQTLGLFYWILVALTTRMTDQSLRPVENALTLNDNR